MRDHGDNKPNGSACKHTESVREPERPIRDNASTLACHVRSTEINSNEVGDGVVIYKR